MIVGEKNDTTTSTNTNNNETAKVSTTTATHGGNATDSQLLELKQALMQRTRTAIELTQIKLSRSPISRICKDLYEYCYSVDEPFGSEQTNPWKKSAPTSLLQQSTTQRTNNSKTYSEFKTELSSVIAFGLPGSKCDELLKNLKQSEKITDVERIYYQNYFTDLAISTLRIIIKYNIINAIPFQNKSNSIENAHRILKVKDDTFNKRPLAIPTFNELKSFWNDPSVVSTYCHHREQLLPLYLIQSINQFNVCNRVFGERPKRLDEAEILQLIHQPLENSLPEYALSDLRILNISSLKVENIENWIHDFTDTKSFVWVCSLASFDSIEEVIKKQTHNIKSTRILPRTKSLSTIKGKGGSTSNINLTTSNSNGSISSPGLNGNGNNNNNNNNNVSLGGSGGSGFLNNSSQLINSNSNTSLSSYNEDSNVSVDVFTETLSNNNLVRSVELFRYFTRFIKRPAILFFTDRDLFVEKIKKGADFKQYFPDYKGTPRDVIAIFEYIKQLFVPLNGINTHTTVHTSTLNAFEDLKVISATIFAIVAQESIDILI
ncbi:hypothetical protein RB653_005824 [Dictyostelium firmibasis]|uniref:G protein gamma domain-containing protein n=1 Tax=Dictyostelium firmibasis TaxID=79012 RepID=A0AAN7UA85_9MYCE